MTYSPSEVVVGFLCNAFVVAFALVFLWKVGVRFRKHCLGRRRGS